MTTGGGQQRIDWFLVPGIQNTIALQKIDGTEWGSAPVALFGPLDAPLLPNMTATLSGASALFTLSEATLDTLLLDFPVGGDDAPLWHVQHGGEPFSTGVLLWDTTGQGDPDKAIPVVAGPPGPTALSTDPGNVAEFGTDGLLFVPSVGGAVQSVNGQTGTVVLGAADVGASPAGHDHAGVYSPVAHDHDLDYSPLAHNHDLEYSPLSHDHAGVYAPAGHDHAGVYAPAGHDHAGVYSPVAHDHAGVYSPVAHDHAGVYSPVAHDHAGVYAPALGADDNYVTDAEKAKLAALSGTNSGDQDLSGYLLTSAAAELIRDTMAAALVAGTNVTITPNDGADTITIAATGGGASAYELRHDTAGGYDYTGTAPDGSAESASVWTITRITLTSPPVTGVATGAEWTNRAIEVYS